MGNDGDRLRGLWDKYAPRYDRDIGLFERLQFGGGRDWVCAQATGDVLEVAVGTGLNLAHYPDQARVTGIDFSPAMLELARRRAEDLGREVVLTEADAQALPFPDASFDTVARWACAGSRTRARRSWRCTGCCAREGSCCCLITSAAITS